MKKLIMFLLGIVFLLSGCSNKAPTSENQDSSCFSVPAYKEESSFLDAFLENLPEAYASENEITMFRWIPLEDYQIHYIQQFGVQAVRYEYATPRLMERAKSRDGSYEWDRETDKLRQTDQVHFGWESFGKVLTEKEARALLQEQASRRGLKRYGDADYYVDDAVERKNADVRFQIMWMQDNHVFSIWMPGFSEISEENIADYCHAEAFTVKKSGL